MKEVYEFLKDAGVYYIATMDGDQPRVRPFGTVLIFEDKLYIQTAKTKDVSKQISINPKIEISAMNNGKWIRIRATLVNDDRILPKQALLDDYPSLANKYKADDEINQVLYLENACATIESFTEEKKIIIF